MNVTLLDLEDEVEEMEIDGIPHKLKVKKENRDDDASPSSRKKDPKGKIREVS